ncbi:MAG: hypothetical protein LQ342_003115 [Letrouitia transgressa]|nr:MAG: hypothetical protein LQ342_003115 [Letrouitia transgressa]
MAASLARIHNPLFHVMRTPIDWKRYVEPSEIERVRPDIVSGGSQMLLLTVDGEHGADIGGCASWCLVISNISTIAVAAAKTKFYSNSGLLDWGDAGALGGATGTCLARSAVVALEVVLMTREARGKSGGGLEALRMNLYVALQHIAVANQRPGLARESGCRDPEGKRTCEHISGHRCDIDAPVAEHVT